MSEQKRCTTCGRDLPLGDFYADRRNRDGQYSECRSCVADRRKGDLPKRRAADKARRAHDPETARAHDAAYYQAHRAERNEAQRRYRAKSKGQDSA